MRNTEIKSELRFMVIENILDVMSMVKLNVLHLHASDNCRFSVESKIYPNYEGKYFLVKQDDGTNSLRQGREVWKKNPYPYGKT